MVVDRGVAESRRHTAGPVEGSPEDVVVRRTAAGWRVEGPFPTLPTDTVDDLGLALALADLLAGGPVPGRRPARPVDGLDEVSQLRSAIRQLEHALASRVVVEQAIGVLTERWRVAPRDAFEQLRRVTRSHGLRIHELAIVGGRVVRGPGRPAAARAGAAASGGQRAAGARDGARTAGAARARRAAVPPGARYEPPRRSGLARGPGAGAAGTAGPAAPGRSGCRTSGCRTSGPSTNGRTSGSRTSRRPGRPDSHRRPCDSGPRSRRRSCRHRPASAAEPAVPAGIVPTPAHGRQARADG